MTTSRPTGAKIRRSAGPQAASPAGTVALAAALGLLALSGCFERESGPGPTFSYHTTPAATAAQRVAVLPFASAERIGRSAWTVNPAMTASLRELGSHEVVAVSRDSIADLLPGDVFSVNSITTAQLLGLRDRLNVDAVLLGRVEQFDSFDPIAIGLTCHLVSCRDGQVLWSATGHFDGRRDDVQRDLRRWYEHSIGYANPNLSGWTVALQSPAQFTRYVCDRLVATIPWQAAGR